MSGFTGHTLLALFFAAGSIPSAIIGLTVWCFQKKMEKLEKRRVEQEKSREQLDLLIVQGSNAAISLAEATARAVERIPDTHCNGDMHEALAYAKGVKHDIRAFLEEQGIRAVVK